ncbi:unnamed protein product [marine sediment metagenome]|uniref:Uncharacterized protein n=1 Tax=marine sediment metagenome TaxID=412755 RepID=X0U5P8_9ZZZZ
MNNADKSKRYKICFYYVMNNKVMKYYFYIPLKNIKNVLKCHKDIRGFTIAEYTYPY